MDYGMSLFLAIVIVVGFGVCSWSYLKAHWDAQLSEEYSNELFRIYDQIWSGDPADRETAWFRVIGYLERNNYPEEMITEARIHKIFAANDGQNSSYKVNSNGRLVRVDEIGGQDPEAV